MSEKTQKIQQYKTDAVNAIKKSIETYSDFILTDFRGLNVEKITELRNKLKSQDSILKIVKNNFTRIALSDIKYPDISNILFGPTALALIKNDSGQVARILFDYAKSESISVKGGIIDGRVMSRDDVEALSKLPGKNQLISMLMSAMTGPVRNMMYAMNGVTQKLVRTLKAVEEKKAKE
ncbi:MAG: 50S ribosomal protein L10 [Spirochaetales bacterium]|nr:50S ribosomal protein L10 [Spirochaetales bacterium]